MPADDLNRPDLDGGFDLGAILGARSRVAVLREVVRATDPIWPVWIVNWTGLSRSSVWEALRRLEAAGVVEPAAFAPRGQVPWRMPPGHPLKGPLVDLFEVERVSRLSERQRRAERDRVEAAYARLRELVPASERDGRRNESRERDGAL